LQGVNFRCDAFGDIGTDLRELAWKTPIFSETLVPVSPNASYLGQVDEPYDPQPSGSGLPTGGKVMVTTPY
jgi:hypothetical protein